MISEEEKLLLLEDISARLPFGLAFITKQGMIEMDVINLADRYKVWAYKKKDKHGNEIGLNAETLKGERCRGKGFRLGDIKPILYPLSSITEEIFVNGSEICPMKYLSEAFDFDGYMGLYTTWNFDEERECVEFFAWGCKVCEMSLQSFFITPEEGKHNSTQLGLRHFQQVFHVLHQCHIDYRNLIAQGLAVSALVLDNNSYK